MCICYQESVVEKIKTNNYLTLAPVNKHTALRIVNGLSESLSRGMGNQVSGMFQLESRNTRTNVFDHHIPDKHVFKSTTQSLHDVLLQ